MGTPRQLDTADTVSRGETIVATDMGRETVMMSIETGQYFHLDDIASDVWRRLEQPRRIGDLIRQLTESYHVAPDVCLRDTLVLLAGWVKAGIVRVTSEAPSSAGMRE